MQAIHGPRTMGAGGDTTTLYDISMFCVWEMGLRGRVVQVGQGTAIVRMVAGGTRRSTLVLASHTWASILVWDTLVKRWIIEGMARARASIVGFFCGAGRCRLH